MATVMVPLDDELVALMRGDREPVEQVAREMIVLELYRRGTISSGKAAELLGIGRADFIRISSRLGIPYIDMTDEEWAAEMAIIRSG